jgi:ABC-type polysaccharide/polyol phosphate transport system ATPase subunit
MMLSCKEATQLVSQGLDRRLGLAERVALRLHLLICDGCTQFRRQTAFLRKAMKRLKEQTEPDPRS